MEILANKLYRSPVECLDSDAYDELYDATLEVCKIQAQGRIKVNDLMPGMIVYLPKSEQVKHAGEYTYIRSLPGNKVSHEFADIFGNRLFVDISWDKTLKLLKYKG